MHLINLNIDDIDYEGEAANNTAIVLCFDTAEYIMYADDYNSHAIDFYYLLPDKMYYYYGTFI